jgi:hypothetical protein
MARRGSIPCVACVFVLITYTSLSSKFDRKGSHLMWCGHLRTSPSTRGLKTAFPEMKVSLLLRPSLARQSSLTIKSGFPDGKYGLKEGRLDEYTGKSRLNSLSLGERKKNRLFRRFSTCQVMTRRVSVPHDLCFFVHIVYTSLSRVFDRKRCALIRTFGC